MAPRNTQHLFSHIISLAAILTAVCLSGVTSVPPGYQAMRRALIRSEQVLRVGGLGDLSPDEQKVDAVLMREKRVLIEATRLNGSSFASVYSFLNVTARAAMESTTAFSIIQRMPKGGILHTHDESITSIEWLVKNVTYRPHCYMCVDSSYNIRFHFFLSPPRNPGCEWRLVSEFRGDAGNATMFDQSLHNNLTMVTADPARAYPTINAVWAKFSEYFAKVEGLILHAPVFADYLWEGLRQMREDHVQYVEIRALLLPMYELDGRTRNSSWVLSLYRQVVSRFVQQYPDFIGARVIKCSLRFKPAEDILGEVKEAMRLYADNRDFLKGFDLVGQEDPYHPLLYYIDALLYPSQQTPPVHLPYFFHAGETDWQETATDYNLVDAILLNTTRIGHGYALFKHPQLMKAVRDRGIAVEVNPISNQVLKLVDDPRNHPVAALLAQNMPVVISSDDNASWEALSLTHDFYVTFMALTGEETGLAALKQLAKNSLRYSALTDQEKVTALRRWSDTWDTFIRDMVQELKLA
ncbi:adenosine deaminase AGSA-like [Babylonia areolata]|uniref:adenosine deaminase AGSA-like n=1 Tax=Babylonia areolata TaxID=304850 RepID=UPI003FD338EA